MNTTEQSEFLDSIMQELDSDPDTTQAEKQLIKVGYAVVKSSKVPQRLYAGYEAGYYYIRLNGDTRMGMIAKLKALGYTLHFLQPPFGKPSMLKKRID